MMTGMVGGGGGVHAGRSVVSSRPIANNNRLNNIISDIYKHEGRIGTIGDGTTMAAVSSEVRTRPIRNHFTKLAEIQQGLENLHNKGHLSSGDMAIVDELLQSIQRAWGGGY
jgi:hypothetical protein